MSYKLKRLPDVAVKLSDFEKVCAITVALKISDDSCKMDLYECTIFMRLYDYILKTAPSLFTDDVFKLIKQVQEEPNMKLISEIKALRENAMEMITRPKMKAFKASIRTRIS